MADTRIATIFEYLYAIKARKDIERHFYSFVFVHFKENVTFDFDKFHLLM